MSGSSRELRKLLRALKAAGIKVEPTQNGHYKLDLREGVEVIGGTPSKSTLDALHRLIRRSRAIGRAGAP